MLFSLRRNRDIIFNDNLNIFAYFALLLNLLIINIIFIFPVFVVIFMTSIDRFNVFSIYFNTIANILRFFMSCNILLLFNLIKDSKYRFFLNSLRRIQYKNKRNNIYEIYRNLKFICVFASHYDIYLYYTNIKRNLFYLLKSRIIDFRKQRVKRFRCKKL